MQWQTKKYNKNWIKTHVVLVSFKYQNNNAFGTLVLHKDQNFLTFNYPHAVRQ